MKRTRESAKENTNAKRQTTLASFVIKPRIPTYFHLHHSTKDNTFSATFTDVNPCSGTMDGFQVKIYWPGSDMEIMLSTNIRNGSFEDQDAWQQKCRSLSSSVASHDKKYYEKLETRLLDGIESRDTSIVISSAAAMVCFERDWSDSPVNGLRRLLHVISSVDIEKEDQKHYVVLVWLQCAETKGFMVTPSCVDYLLSYVEIITKRRMGQKEKVKNADAKSNRATKPTLDRILLLKDKNTEIRDLLLAMYIRSEYLSNRQGKYIDGFC